jgi:hypothetical protein
VNEPILALGVPLAYVTLPKPLLIETDKGVLESDKAAPEAEPLLELWLEVMPNRLLPVIVGKLPVKLDDVAVLVTSSFNESVLVVFAGMM